MTTDKTTPRTDEEENLFVKNYESIQECGWPSARSLTGGFDFARQLERELAKVKEQLAEAKLPAVEDVQAAFEIEALKQELAKSQSALHRCLAATGEEAGDIDDFRALVDREEHVVKAVQELRSERDHFNEQLAEWDNSAKIATDEKCTANEHHCTCVPLLRVKLQEAEARYNRLRGAVNGMAPRDLERLEFLEKAVPKLEEQLRQKDKALRAANKDAKSLDSFVVTIEKELRRVNDMIDGMPKVSNNLILNAGLVHDAHIARTGGTK